MGNGVYFIISGLCISILINLVFFSKKRISSYETKIYGYLIIANLCGLILELGCSIICSVDIFPNIMRDVFVKTYLSFLVGWAILFLYYVLIITCDSYENIRTRLMKFSTPLYILIILLLFLLPVNHIKTANYIYASGTAVMATYLLTGLCVFIMLIVMFTHIRKLKNKKYLPLFTFIILGSIVSIIQAMYPQLLMITAMEAYVMLMMYFTIENPDLKLLKQTEEAKIQAEKSNRAKSDFLSSMSHEIRTPLNAIVGLSEDNLNYKDNMPKEVLENSQDIINASQTLLEIVGNILDINKIESQKMEIMASPYNPRETIETLAKIDATRIGDKPIDFKLSIAEDLPYELIGDKVHIKQIINNLLSNAIKYTEKGEINLSVRCINQNDISNLIISVQDTGRGIKAENINKLFTKFERLDIEKNSTTEGTGLGLAITKSLVEMMGGKINVQSTYGQGSIFVVQIPQKISKITNPLTNTQAIKLTEIRKEELKNANYGNKKILIVDDNKLNIKVARRALQDFNFEIDECYDGLECLGKVANGNEYDLILMDIMMPSMSGETAIAKLKENPNFNIPTIALTADAVAGAKEKYISEGFIDYIAKPFNKEQIKEKLDVVFNQENNPTNQIQFDDEVINAFSDMSKSVNEIVVEKEENNNL